MADLLRKARDLVTRQKTLVDEFHKEHGALKDKLAKAEKKRDEIARLEPTVDEAMDYFSQMIRKASDDYGAQLAGLARIKTKALESTVDKGKRSNVPDPDSETDPEKRAMRLRQRAIEQDDRQKNRLRDIKELMAPHIRSRGPSHEPKTHDIGQFLCFAIGDQIEDAIRQKVLAGMFKGSGKRHDEYRAACAEVEAIRSDIKTLERDAAEANIAL